MCKKTKQTFIIAVVTSLLSFSICLFLFYEIRAQGLSLEEHVDILNENNKKEAAYSNLNKLIKETEKERNKIENIFLSNQSEGLDFVNEIEIIAPSLGLSLETKGLGNPVDEETGIESVAINFVYSGTKSSVLGFTKLMENIPYHSSVESLSIRETGPDDFEGEITIHITIQNL